MSLEIQNIDRQHETLKQNIINIIESQNIKFDELSSKDIKSLISYYRKYSELKWVDMNKFINNFTKRYISTEDVSFENKVAFIFTDDTNIDIDFKSHMNFIIDYFNKEFDRIICKERIINLINRDLLVFTFDDMKKLSINVVNSIIRSYLLYSNTNSKPRRKIQRTQKKQLSETGNSDIDNDPDVLEARKKTADNNDDSDSDSDDNEGCDSESNDSYKYYSSKYTMSGMHEFIIIAFMTFYNENKKDIDNRWYQALVKSSHKKLMLFPQNVTLLSGELLSQIETHYDTVKISSLIECRRQLGVILNNQTHQFYTYKDFKSMNYGYCYYLSIELPYMCYARVSHIEMDLIESDVEHKIAITNGKDYILRTFSKKPEEKYKFQFEYNTITKKNEKDELCTYISIYFGIMEYMRVKNLRVFGEAISFV